MTSRWMPTRLSEILTRSETWVSIEPDRVYREITVRLRGKGVVLRREVQGSEIAAAKRRVVKAGEFILSRIDARNGAFGIVPPELHGAVVSSDFPLFRPNPIRLEPAFLEWLSKTSRFIDLCRAASEGTTNRVRLKEDRFLAMEVRLPPLPEQRRIVAWIENIADRLSEVQAVRRQATEGFRQLLGSAFARIVATSRRMRMGEVAPLARRPVEVQPDAEYPELGIRSFGKGTFHKPSVPGLSLGTKRLYRIEPGDLLFNNVFAWEGAVAVVREADAGRFGSHRFMTCVPKKRLASAEFLKFYFLTAEGLESLGSASPGGAGRNRTLGVEALAEIAVPVPEAERVAWFDRLLAMRDQIEVLDREMEPFLGALIPAVISHTVSGDKL